MPSARSSGVGRSNGGTRIHASQCQRQPWGGTDSVAGSQVTSLRRTTGRDESDLVNREPGRGGLEYCQVPVVGTRVPHPSTFVVTASWFSVLS